MENAGIEAPIIMAHISARIRKNHSGLAINKIRANTAPYLRRSCGFSGVSVASFMAEENIQNQSQNKLSEKYCATDLVIFDLFTLSKHLLFNQFTTRQIFIINV